MAALLSVKSIETNANFASPADCTSQPQLYNNEDLEKKRVHTQYESEEVRHEISALKKEYTGIKKYAGMILTLAVSLLTSLTILVVKVLDDYGFHTFGISFWRYLGISLPCIPLLIYYECGSTGKQSEKISVFASVWPVHKDDNWRTIIRLFIKGILGSTAILLRYAALHYLTIGDTSVITYSYPVLVTILAHFFLKNEKCGIIPIVAGIVTLGGVVLITRPPMLTGAQSFDSDTLIGCALAVGCLVCAALSVIITRKVRKVQYALVTFTSGVIGVLQALVLTTIFDDFSFPEHLNDYLLILALGVLSFLSQIAIILALKIEEAGPYALIRSSDVIFGFVFQFIFLGVIPDEYSSIGGIAILTAIIVTGLRKWLSLLPANDKRREQLCILLR